MGLAGQLSNALNQGPTPQNQDMEQNYNMSVHILHNHRLKIQI